ncbi:MAG: septal ring lytic transglycosylase RlpA family protein [Rhodanobacteraceae bacterium]
MLAIAAVLAACGTMNVAYRYRVDGRTYSVLRNASHYDKTGIASWYGPAYQGRPTASGEIYDMYVMTAASKVLPFYSYVRVTNLENGDSEVVLINDRGPFYPGRIIDLSYAAAQGIGMAQQGTSRVRVQVLRNHRALTASVTTVATPTVASQTATAATISAPAVARVAPEPAVSAATFAPAASTPPAVPPTVTGQFLQAGLFIVPQDADRLRNRLQENGLAEVQLQAATYGGQPATIVVVGPLFGRAALREAKAVLAMEGIQSIPHTRQ